jgi:hypothetical protein
MSINTFFTKENLDFCLSKLAKEYRKRNGTQIRAEIILIGGAAILSNYGFRDMTYDIDTIIRASSSMKEAINVVGDELGLPNGWMNSDFIKTSSYSSKLVQYSKYYKRFGYVLDVRTITGEYLIAMKLMSGRKYKNDLSDIVGILYEEQEKGNPISLEQIQTAVVNLYDRWEALPQDSNNFIYKIINNNDLKSLYDTYRTNEHSTKESLIEFETSYPKVANTDNINDIIKQLQARKYKSP